MVQGTGYMSGAPGAHAPCGWRVLRVLVVVAVAVAEEAAVAVAAVASGAHHSETPLVVLHA